MQLRVQGQTRPVRKSTSTSHMGKQKSYGQSHCIKIWKALFLSVEICIRKKTWIANTVWVLFFFFWDTNINFHHLSRALKVFSKSHWFDNSHPMAVTRSHLCLFCFQLWGKLSSSRECWQSQRDWLPLNPSFSQFCMDKTCYTPLAGSGDCN